MASKGSDSQTIQSYGEYYLTKRIAYGGMAELFRARRRAGVEGFEKTLAIKRILPHLSSDRDFITMFIDEAKIAAQLTHENIVQIFDFGKFEESYYLAMEYVWGKSLQAVQAKGKDQGLPTNLALYVISRASMGLDYAHRKKGVSDEELSIIHRDISPQNILVSYEGEVKLVDFGIAKAAVQSSETKSGILKGKIPFMSPEQVTGGSVDHRSDIFSLGIVLYQSLTGQKLFQGASEFEVIEKVKLCQIPAPSERVASIPKKVNTLVLKALERDPEKRYQTAEEFYNGLVNYLDEQRTYLGPSDLRHYMRERFGEEIRQEEIEIQKEAGLVRHHEKHRIRGEIQTGQSEEALNGKKLRRFVPGLKKNLLRAGGIGILSLAAYGLITLTSIRGKLDEKEAKISDGGPSASEPVQEKNAFLQNIISEASLLLTQGNYDEAIARFDQVFSVDSQFAAQYHLLFSKAFLCRGRENRDKSAASALQDFRRACQMDPENFEVHFEMGRLFTEMKKYREAILSYQKAIEINPDFPDAHFNLGYLYFTKKAHILAAEEFEVVVKLKPQYLKDAYYNLGLSYLNIGEKKKALKAFRNALKLDPKNKRIIGLVRNLQRS
jgi:serine/threonine protein kinase